MAITIQNIHNHEGFPNKKWYKARQNRGLTAPHADHLACPHASESIVIIVAPLQKKKQDCNIMQRSPDIYDCPNNGDISWFISCWILYYNKFWY